MASDTRDPRSIATADGLLQKSDAGTLEAIVRDVIDTQPEVVAQFKAGKESALQFLIGQGMKVSKGSANPQVLKELFQKFLR